MSETRPARHTTVLSGARRIDAWLHLPEGAPRGALVACHPHPAHGGHMDHPVVLMLVERAVLAGLAALRFDFRGVRLSEGRLEDADGHLEDVRHAALAVRRAAGEGPLLGGGFSYGARMLARAARPDVEPSPGFEGLLLLAPAVHVPSTPRDFGNLLLGRALRDAPPDPHATETLARIPIPARVLVGSADPVAPADTLRGLLPAAVGLDVLAGLNHFFSRALGAGETARDVLGPALDRALAWLLAATAR